MRRLALLIAFGAAVAVAAGCSTLEYYSQAINGHLEVMRRAEPIAERMADPATPRELVAKLERVIAIREFATAHLGLPDNGSYRSYADLDRPFVVWNVFTAPEFAIEPNKSCFPIVGCVSYRGYYSEEDANRYADAQRREGHDVMVYGVPAYSTLGWFDDPVLNTFVRYPEGELARLIFHELAHQIVYVKGDTAFNESFAVAVEEEGVKRWLARHATAVERERYATLRARRAEFTALVLRYRERLDAFYREPRAVEEKRAGKSAILAAMVDEYRALRDGPWGGWKGYDRLLEVSPNNALLASIATYEELVPAFRTLLAREDGNLWRFYAEVKKLAQLAKTERDSRLAALQHAAPLVGSALGTRFAPLP
jgi:predicted aminopeptidase